MGARLRHWLTGLLAGLFALAVLVAPAQNARSVLERTAFLLAYALPDGSLPEICSGAGDDGDGHGPHLLMPACFACVLMAVPGLPVALYSPAARVAAAVAVVHGAESARAAEDFAWIRQPARAPPTASSSV